eukprot:Gb_38197 [translate_table: standard]
MSVSVHPSLVMSILPRCMSVPDTTSSPMMLANPHNSIDVVGYLCCLPTMSASDTLHRRRRFPKLPHRHSFRKMMSVCHRDAPASHPTERHGKQVSSSGAGKIPPEKLTDQPNEEEHGRSPSTQMKTCFVGAYNSGSSAAWWGETHQQQQAMPAQTIVDSLRSLHEWSLVIITCSGPFHRWLNKVDDRKESWDKDGIILAVVNVFLRNDLVSRHEHSLLIQKLKLIQQRFPNLQIFGIQYASSLGCLGDITEINKFILKEYITFPVLLSTKDFSKVSCTR